MAANGEAQPNLWRRIFEEVRSELGTKRDENGVVGSINWLRKGMAARGANPNVVRNIIYRDKGKLSDKRVLFDILSGLREEAGGPPLQVPELELLSASGGPEGEVMGLLGREKRHAYTSFVNGVRKGENPKLILTGKPGSGKTLLTDAIQSALESEPSAAKRVLRAEFAAADLSTSLNRLALAVGVNPKRFETSLAKIGISSAYAVQADAQAEVARTLLEAFRSEYAPRVLLLHLSGSLHHRDELGGVALRLNTPEVPRVNAAEWVWATLLVPMSRLPDLSLLVSTTNVPARVLPDLTTFEGPLKLNPPTAAEARRFVKARLPSLTEGAQEALVSRAGRSFEELRTLTLLEPLRTPHYPIPKDNEAHVERLSRLIESGDETLRDFLACLAVLSTPEFPTFHEGALRALRKTDTKTFSPLEEAFLDAVPAAEGRWRPFSRWFARALRRRLEHADAKRYRELHRRASLHYAPAATADPKGEAAARYLHHLFEGRDWDALIAWLQRGGVPQPLLRRIWGAAAEELPQDERFGHVAQGVAAHYVKLGSYEHPDVVAAFETLALSAHPDVRAWTALKRAEGAVRRGHFDEAERLLDGAPDLINPALNAEMALTRANIARWRGSLDLAAGYVSGARTLLPEISREGIGGLIHAKVAVWAGLIAKDGGDLTRALEEFESVHTDDDLIRARVAFQRGDVRMRLGRFGGALCDLSEAVALSREAPLSERARYLSRRAVLHRKRAAFRLAERDFNAALETLDHPDEVGSLQHAFERAKVEDERALLLLAQGHFDEALLTLRNNLETFRRYGESLAVDASFRTLRSSLRLALAYWCRGRGYPYRTPLIGAVLVGEGADEPADVAHARRLLRLVDAQLDHAEHFGPLHAQAKLLSSLLSPPEEAVAAAERALREARFLYPRAVALAHLAAAHLWEDAERALVVTEEAVATLTEVDAGGDTGLLAHLRGVELVALLQTGNCRRAESLLLEALDDPRLAPYHTALLRLFGEGAERVAGGSTFERLAARLNLGRAANEPLRLPDRLVLHFQTAHPESVPL